MRDIKFKFWDSKNLKMSKTYTLWEMIDEYGWDYIGCVNKPLQYTGVKDLEDREIYEGYIVKFTPWAHGFVGGCDLKDIIPIPGRIEFHDGRFMVIGEVEKQILSEGLTKIIGNIYENPELLSYNTSGLR